MRTARPTPLVVLTAEERQTLEQWARRPTTAQGWAQRARLVLACASTKTNGEIAATAGGNTSTHTDPGRVTPNYLAARPAGRRTVATVPASALSMSSHPPCRWTIP